MTRWIEIPAHRVLEITTSELANDFEMVDENGELLKQGSIAYRIIRKRDGKVFRAPRFHEAFSDLARLCYLEEI